MTTSFGREAYPRNNLLDALLVTLHLEEGLDLANGQVLPVAQSNQLVKGAKEFVGILENLPLVQALASAGHNLCEKVQGVDILKDVGLTVRDENHVELVEGLVDESNIVLLNGRVLGTTVGKLWERGEQSFYPRPGHLAELPRQDSLAAASAD